MFGPDSGKGSWQGLNLMYEKVRIGSGANRHKRVDAFLQACYRAFIRTISAVLLLAVCLTSCGCEGSRTYFGYKGKGKAKGEGNSKGKGKGNT